MKSTNAEPQNQRANSKLVIWGLLKLYQGGKKKTVPRIIGTPVPELFKSQLYTF